MTEIVVACFKFFTDFGLTSGLIVVLIAFVLAAAAWLLYKIDPTLAKIAENSLVIAKVQEATALSLKATADLLHGMSITFATHDQRASLMHETCKDHGTMICDAKDTFVDYHREIMTKLTEIQGDIKRVG